jgi:hypothetical protein
MEVNAPVFPEGYAVTRNDMDVGRPFLDGLLNRFLETLHDVLPTVVSVCIKPAGGRKNPGGPRPLAFPEIPPRIRRPWKIPGKQLQNVFSIAREMYGRGAVNVEMALPGAKREGDFFVDFARRRPYGCSRAAPRRQRT